MAFTYFLLLYIILETLEVDDAGEYVVSPTPPLKQEPIQKRTMKRSSHYRPDPPSFSEATSTQGDTSLLNNSPSQGSRGHTVVVSPAPTCPPAPPVRAPTHPLTASVKPSTFATATAPTLPPAPIPMTTPVKPSTLPIATEIAPPRPPAPTPPTAPATAPTLPPPATNNETTGPPSVLGKRRSAEAADPEYNKKIAVKTEEGRFRVGTLKVDGPRTILDKYAVPVDSRTTIKKSLTKVEVSRLKAKKERKRGTTEEFEEWHERVRKVVQLDQEKAATKRDLDGLDQAALEAARDFLEDEKEFRDLYK